MRITPILMHTAVVSLLMIALARVMRSDDDDDHDDADDDDVDRRLQRGSCVSIINSHIPPICKPPDVEWHRPEPNDSKL